MHVVSGCVPILSWRIGLTYTWGGVGVSGFGVYCTCGRGLHYDMGVVCDLRKSNTLTVGSYVKWWILVSLRLAVNNLVFLSFGCFRYF